MGEFFMMGEFFIILGAWILFVVVLVLLEKIYIWLNKERPQPRRE